MKKERKGIYTRRTRWKMLPVYRGRTYLSRGIIKPANIFFPIKMSKGSLLDEKKKNVYRETDAFNDFPHSRGTERKKDHDFRVHYYASLIWIFCFASDISHHSAALSWYICTVTMPPSSLKIQFCRLIWVAPLRERINHSTEYETAYGTYAKNIFKCMETRACI